MAQHVSYRTEEVDGLADFYRQAGPRDAPTHLLLHGLPSSSRRLGPLLTRLADDCHMVAPDYLGFWHSDAPNPKELSYTFDNIAKGMDCFGDALQPTRCTLYLHRTTGDRLAFAWRLANPIGCRR